MKANLALPGPTRLDRNVPWSHWGLSRSRGRGAPRLTLGSVVSSSPSGSSADFSHFCPQVVERRRTPAEIREEFERLQREREERRLQQRTNPKVSGWFWGEQRSDVVSAAGSYSEAVRIGRNRVSLIRSQSATCLEGHWQACW